MDIFSRLALSPWRDPNFYTVFGVFVYYENVIDRIQLANYNIA
jgi:hypothetical protein